MNLIALSLSLAGIGVGWLVMIHGWGIEPQSWTWIVGGSVAAIFLLGAAQFISKN